jgi:hypothetical protein
MAFPKNGVVKAPSINPSEYGLFSVAKPEDSSNENRWIRGFAQEWSTSLYAANLWDATDTTSDSVATDSTPLYYTDIDPFFIEVEEVLSTFGFLGLDRIERIKAQIEGVTQKAVEQELWDGAIRQGETHPNAALSSASATLLNSGTALNAARALALLDYKISEVSPCGEQGVIHMTRDAASILSSSYMIFHKENHLQTVSGTPIIIGSGYSGTGPTGATGATASDTNKWMYGTGTVKTYVGEIDVVNDNMSQAYDVDGNQNDMRLKAIRPAAVYFDTTIHLAVRVDLSAAI